MFKTYVVSNRVKNASRKRRGLITLQRACHGFTRPGQRRSSKSPTDHAIAHLIAVPEGKCRHRYDKEVPLYDDGVECGSTAVCSKCDTLAIAETFMNET